MTSSAANRKNLHPPLGLPAKRPPAEGRRGRPQPPFLHWGDNKKGGEKLRLNRKSALSERGLKEEHHVEAEKYDWSTLLKRKDGVLASSRVRAGWRKSGKVEVGGSEGERKSSAAIGVVWTTEKDFGYQGFEA